MKPVSCGIAMFGWLSSIKRRSVVPVPIGPTMKIGPWPGAGLRGVEASMRVTLGLHGEAARRHPHQQQSLPGRVDELVHGLAGALPVAVVVEQHDPAMGQPRVEV